MLILVCYLFFFENLSCPAKTDAVAINPVEDYQVEQPDGHLVACVLFLEQPVRRGTEADCPPERAVSPPPPSGANGLWTLLTDFLVTFYPTVL